MSPNETVFNAIFCRKILIIAKYHERVNFQFKYGIDEQKKFKFSDCQKIFNNSENPIYIMAIELRIGSKGELFLPKALREKMNLSPGDRIFLEEEENKLIIRKIRNLGELLDEPPLVGPFSEEDIKKRIAAEQKQQEKLSLEDV